MNFSVLCSTPTGIKGLGRPLGFFIPGDEFMVLNAYWHQRFGQEDGHSD